jgi:hypothetical protein
MTAPRPVPFHWDGETMRPLLRFASLCDRQFVVGETYTLVPHEERSRRSHNHFFASIAEIWNNLPERIAPRFPTPEHLRKYALIRCGYADKREVVLATEEEALRVAAFICPIDSYALVTVNGPVVTIYTAQSQAERAMNRKLFSDAKRDVLEFLDQLVGVDSDARAEVAARNQPHLLTDRTRNAVEEVA